MTEPAPSLADLSSLLPSEGLFHSALGITLTGATPECVTAELTVTRALCTQPGVMHGGAIMAFADTLGAIGTSLNLAPGAGTTTLESKTNFFAAGIEGAKVLAECTPLHRGRRTQVWQTQLRREDGKLVAQVTQTQVVLEAKLSPSEQMAGLFAGLSRGEQQALLAQLERAGGAMYQHWASSEDGETRKALLAASQREVDNASLLEGLAKK